MTAVRSSIDTFTGEDGFRVARWQNIGHKLPLLMTALLVAAVVVISTMAYREMERTLFTSAGQRVVNVSRQVATALATSNDRLQRQGSPLTHDSLLSVALLHPGDASLATAQRRLERERTANPQLASIELWSWSGIRLLSAGNAPRADPGFHGHAPLGVGPFVATQDTVWSQVEVPVIHGAADTLGFVRELSRISSGQSRDLLVGLIGGQATLLVGNRSGDVWTDLDQRVDGPRVPLTAGTLSRATAADGTRWIGALATVPGAPWLVWVARPESIVTGATHAFLLRMILLAVVVIGLGALGAAILSRHILGPLADVTHAAEGLAAGNYSVRVAIPRRDEVGRLAATFNGMAAAIEGATHGLEQQRVKLETQQAQLETANDALLTKVDEVVRAQKLTEAAQARASAIVSGAPAAVITTDADAIIVEFNPAAEKTFGYTAAQAIGRPLDALIPTVKSELPRTGLASYFERHDAHSLGSTAEVTGLRADGSQFPADVAVTRIPIHGPPMFTCFVRDLTERKHLEAQLQQAQRMESIGRLAGGVAHDFNNILTVIINCAELVLREPSLDGEVREDLVQVRQAADRAAALTRQLLAFSRKQVLHATVLDINSVVGDVATMLARVIPTSIRLDVRPGQSIDSVHADRGQLEQVLMNLAVNARDAMLDGGVLTIETFNAVLDDAYVALHPDGAVGPHVVLSVRDTGVGMSPEVQERIFEPFFTTKGAGEGTGLGLATVYGIVRQSGGSTYVYSEPGHGTTFKVYFPAYAPTVAVVEPSSPPPPAAPPVNILLVEDDYTVRDAVRSVLEHLGHRVSEAYDVPSALEFLRAADQHCDVVLTDAVMPGRSGLDLAATLKRERPDLAVILMSGYAEETVSGRVPIPPGVLFVEKPFTAHAIARAIADVTGAVQSAG